MHNSTIGRRRPWRVFALTALLGVAGYAAADELDAGLGSCGACHQGALAFNGRNVEVVAKRLREIRDGKKRHVPLGFKDTSDEAMGRIAAALTGVDD